MQIKAKDSTGASKTNSFTLNVSDNATALTNNSKISATTINKGASVTMTGAATGGTTPYQYAYVAQSPDGKWTVLKNYSSDTSYVFTPASLGKYNIHIRYKQSE